MISDFELGWIVAWLEGEGAFCRSGHTMSVTASQVQREPLERCQAMFGGKIYRFEQMSNGVLRPYHRWGLTGTAAAALMMTVFCRMSPKRKGQIKKVLLSWRATKPRERHRSHCPKGHPYDQVNTYVHPTNGSRQCIACRQRWGWYAKKAEGVDAARVYAHQQYVQRKGSKS